MLVHGAGQEAALMAGLAKSFYRLSASHGRVPSIHFDIFPVGYKDKDCMAGAACHDVSCLCTYIDLGPCLAHRIDAIFKKRFGGTQKS